MEMTLAGTAKHMDTFLWSGVELSIGHYSLSQGDTSVIAGYLVMYESLKATALKLFQGSFLQENILKYASTQRHFV